MMIGTIASGWWVAFASRYGSMYVGGGGGYDAFGCFLPAPASGTAVKARIARNTAKPRPPLPQRAFARESPPRFPVPQRALERTCPSVPPLSRDIPLPFRAQSGA